MTMHQLRRLERLEQLAQPAWRTTLRASARMSGYDEGPFLRAVQGHERELAEGMGPAGQITYEAFQLLSALLKQAGLRPARLPREPDRAGVTWEEFQHCYKRLQPEANSSGSPEPAAPRTLPGGDQR